MQYREYGIQNKETIILLHGGGLSWWNYRDEAILLQERYHVILPILDGHSGSDRHFTSIQDNAVEIIDFIDRYHKGHVLLMSGLSLGAQILLEILSLRKDICRYALIESPLIIPSVITSSLTGPSINLSYQLINKPSFARAQFKSLRIREDLFDDYYRDTCNIEKADLIAFLKANASYTLKYSFKDTLADIHIYAGSKDNVNVIRSARMIHTVIPSASLNFLPEMYHGEFSLNHPDLYAYTILKIIDQTFLIDATGKI